MTKPTNAKEQSPKDDGARLGNNQEPKADANTKIIITSSIMTLCICGIFVVINYFMQESLLNSKLKNIPNDEPAEQEHIVDDERGIIMDLGDFVLNLSDVNPRRYLKVNVALELSKTEADIAAEQEASAAKSGGGHGGHGAAPEPVDPMKAIEAEMSQYKPALRDAVISTLSSKTSDELLTITGKELAKEQLSQNIDAVFSGEREVLRVSFGQFIIQ